ncbi:MAG: hypothetical protein ACREN4_03405 [Candidatus Dormibacteria bacterium]
MLTRDFADNVLYANALMYQPPPLQGWLLTLVHLGSANLAALSVGAGALQLLLGLGILYRRSRRLALGASVAWALTVWVAGEGLGGMATGTALVEFGAPGAALLYAVVALLVWPQPRARLGLLGERGARLIWSGLWLLAALLHFQPRFPTGAVLAYNLQSTAQQQPGGLADLDYHLAQLAAAHGLEVALGLAVAELLLAVGVWSNRWRRATLYAGALLTLGFWVLAQALGGLAGGLGSDPGAAPLVLLLALAVHPCRPRPASLPAPAPQPARGRDLGASPAQPQTHG